MLQNGLAKDFSKSKSSEKAAKRLDLFQPSAIERVCFAPFYDSDFIAISCM